MGISDPRQGTVFDPILRVGLGSLFAGCICLMGGCYFGAKKARLAISGVETEATVARIKHTKSSGRRPTLQQHLTLAFEDQEGERQRVFLTRSEDHVTKKGDTVLLRYLPTDPEVFKLAEDSGMPVLMGFVLGIVLLVVGGMTLWRYKP